MDAGMDAVEGGDNTHSGVAAGPVAGIAAVFIEAPQAVKAKITAIIGMMVVSIQKFRRCSLWENELCVLTI
jgi:hypothetical protein